MTSPPSCAECHKIWEPKPPGTLGATLGLLRDTFTFTFLVEFTLYCHTANTANTAVTEPGDTFTNIHEGKYTE